jgi:hypothetical protein
MQSSVAKKLLPSEVPGDIAKSNPNEEAIKHGNPVTANRLIRMEGKRLEKAM